MAKRKVITWPEHKKLLQKRHGSVAAEPKPHKVGPSLNKFFYCGAAAIEMALDYRPDAVAKFWLDQIMDPSQPNTVKWEVGRLAHQYYHADEISGMIYMALERQALMWHEYHQIGGRFRTWADATAQEYYTALLLYTFMYVNPAFRPLLTFVNMQNGTYILTSAPIYDFIIRDLADNGLTPAMFEPAFREWQAAVDARCAALLPFVRPGQSKIERVVPKVVPWEPNDPRANPPEFLLEY